MTKKRDAIKANHTLLRSIINSLDALSVTPYRTINKEFTSTFNLSLQSFSAVRQAARYLENNSPIARAVITYLVNNIVGAKGVQVEALPLTEDAEVDKSLAKKINMLWSLFLREAEVRGNNFAQTQRLACTHYLLDGEVFARKLLYRDKEIGNEFPFILELIASDQLPNTTYESANIYAGIGLNKWNRPVTYHFSREGREALFRGSEAGINTIKVDASEVIHLRHRRRVDEIRGTSLLASAIPTLQDLKDYEEAEMIAAKQLASLVLAVTKNDVGGALVPDFDSYDLDDESREMVGEIERKYLELSRAEETASIEVRPGTSVMNLKPGESITPIEATRQSSNFKLYRSETIKSIAAATGANYSTIARDYSGTYSAQRQELIETWVNVGVHQNEFASQFVEPVYRAFIKNCVAYGYLKPSSSIFLLDNAQYTPPTMPWIDPLKEISASAAGNQAGIISKQEIIRARGGNPEEVFTHLENEEERGFGRSKTIADVRHKEIENEQNQEE